jgi:NADH-quinone oxidoreductase subunit L
MPWIVKNLWLIPALPMLAAGLSALAPQRCRKFSAILAIGSMVIAFLLSLCAFAHTLQHGGHAEAKPFFNFEWLRFAAGDPGVLKLGWVLDPLTAVMLVMVTFVGLLIFIYSIGYMAHDENFTRFFTFLSLFAGAMLGVVIANSLLLLFICWNPVGLTSAHRPASQTQRRRRRQASIRRARDGLLLGMVWLYHASGTLLFYNDAPLPENQACKRAAVAIGPVVATGIALLIFCGAMASPAKCRCTSGYRCNGGRRPSAPSSTRATWWRRVPGGVFTC